VVGPGSKEFPNLFEQFPLKVGDILNQQQYEDAKKKITSAAIRRGYMQAGFAVRELRIHRADKRAEIDLTLDTGPQFVFGETRFGDGEVNHELLQRYRPYEPGDPYRPGKLIELQRLLYGRVAVDGQLDEVDDNTVPITVDLTPPEHLNRYSVGLGYATDTGARVRLEWWNRRLNAKGHQIRTSAQLSQYDSNVLVDYSIPWFDPKIDTFGYNLGYHDLSWEDTDTELITAGVKMDRKGELFRHGGSFEFRNEDYTVGVTSGSSVLFVPTYTANLILADNLLSTKYGLDLSISVSGANESLASDSTYLKGQTNGKAVLTLVPGLRLIGRGSLGAIWVDTIEDLPPSLRFYAGGDQSIRGFGYRELGTEDSSGAVVGGRYLVVASGEIEKSVTDHWSCAAFWDVGNAFDDFSLELEQGVGGGVRYRLPFGQVRFDVASAITDDGMPLRVHLTVGADL
jgi:translocation and assembly module TamA